MSALAPDHLLPLVAGAVLPYATLWATRSAGFRALALRVAATRWHARAGLAAAAVGPYVLGASNGGSVLPAPPAGPALGAASLGLFAYASVETFVAADRMRSYPDDRALHFDLGRPGGWPGTALLIYAAWTSLLAARHRWTAPAYLGSAALWAVDGALSTLPLPPSVALALAADAAVLGLCCSYGPRVGRGRLADGWRPRG
ncbi:hypothetical protein BRC94_03485 [Halobacteriales archaeon QS_5_70_17]|nr:MAG: hypothetical protein BRC94_03485 [Halobacteriales archaeon QS_5_70_17]